MSTDSSWSCSEKHRQFWGGNGVQEKHLTSLRFFHLLYPSIHPLFWIFPTPLADLSIFIPYPPLPISISFLIYLSPKCLSLLSLHLMNVLMTQKDTQLTSHATTLKMWQKASRKMPRRRTRSPSNSSSNPRRPALLNKTVMIVMST